MVTKISVDGTVGATSPRPLFRGGSVAFSLRSSAASRPLPACCSPLSLFLSLSFFSLSPSTLPVSVNMFSPHRVRYACLSLTLETRLTLTRSSEDPIRPDPIRPEVSGRTSGTPRAPPVSQCILCPLSQTIRGRCGTGASQGRLDRYSIDTTFWY